MPIPAAIIEYVPAPAPIREAVTKFGGQPVWLEAPQWPINRALGIPMQFVCQIKLDDVPGLRAELKGPARMAYLFIAEGWNGKGDLVAPGAYTYDPEGGENAVILQPDGDPPLVETRPVATGPTLEDTRERLPTRGQPIELAVKLTAVEEREVRDAESRLGVDAYDQTGITPEFGEDELHRLWAVKLGGLPAMSAFQNHFRSYPPRGPWLPFLQLSHTDLPFFLNLGTDGFGHAFISPDGRRGRFLWHR